MHGVSHDVSHKEVVLAVFGGAFTISSLLLVFLGFTISSYLPLKERDQPPKETLRRLRQAIWMTLGTVVLGIATGALAFVWLLGVELYWVTIAAFAVLIVVVVLVAARTTQQLT